MSDFTPYIEEQTILGRKVKLYVDNYRSEDWYGLKGWRRKVGSDHNAQVYLENAHARLLNLVKPGDVVFDCGANEGYISTLLAIWAGPTGKVLAFEPDPKNVELIRTNAKINGLDNIEAIQKAVSDIDDQEVTFGAEIIGGSPDISYNVQTTTLDKYADLKPSLVKIDVEGYELPVLRGAQKILKQGTTLEVEMHLSKTSGVNMTTRFGFDPDDIVRMFNELGYTMMFDGKEVHIGEAREGIIYCFRESAK